ncbi:MAG: hypothetical protein MRZ79_01200 [Bacteroidia bacterium]|nr:hypothetical protein [Bacteroidia bacterium]
MKNFAIILAGIVGIILISLTFIGANAPETYVYLGRQVPKKYMNEIQSMNLLDEGEKIKYFYSDGLFDIKNGMYFVTDKKLVAYSKSWVEPQTIIPFEEIIFLDVNYDDSFFNDSFIHVMTSDGTELEFPVSSEKGRDKEFYNYLDEKTGGKDEEEILEDE